MHTRTILILGAIAVLLVAGTVWYTLGMPGFTPQAAPAGPAAATSTPHDQNATALHLTDNGTYYTMDAAYPSTAGLRESAGAAADAAAVALMKRALQSDMTSFKADSGLNHLTADDIRIQGLGADRKYAQKITYDIKRGPRTVSYIYTVFADTLGAHPNGTYETFTFDTKTGAQLGLKDIFTSASYLQTLSSVSRAALPAIIAGMEQVSVSEVDKDMLTAGTEPNSGNFADWYFAPDGSLTIIFPPYAVGPYVLGTVTLPIPAAKLSAVLKSEYQ